MSNIYGTVAVLGAGTMGAGIAQVCAQAGSKVVLQDITEEFVQKGLGRIRDFLQKGVEKGKVKAEDRDAVLARITTTTDRKAACRSVALVVEAVPEKLELKNGLFLELADVVSPQCVLASNTSSLSLAMQAVGRRYVRWFNRRHSRTGTLWEGRFRSSLVEADRYLLACQRYIEANPVRAGMAASVSDWPWSSHRHHAGLATDPLVRPHPAVWALGNTPFERESAYRRLFEEAVSQGEYELLRARLLAGKPTASTDFQKKLEQASGVRLIARPVGRPRVRPPPKV